MEVLRDYTEKKPSHEKLVAKFPWKKNCEFRYAAQCTSWGHSAEQEVLSPSPQQCSRPYAIATLGPPFFSKKWKPRASSMMTAPPLPVVPHPPLSPFPLSPTLCAHSWLQGSSEGKKSESSEKKRKFSHFSGNCMLSCLKWKEPLRVGRFPPQYRTSKIVAAKASFLFLAHRLHGRPLSALLPSYTTQWLGCIFEIGTLSDTL